jgi:hypothetical protein
VSSARSITLLLQLRFSNSKFGVTPLDGMPESHQLNAVPKQFVISLTLRPRCTTHDARRNEVTIGQIDNGKQNQRELASY